MDRSNSLQVFYSSQKGNRTWTCGRTNYISVLRGLEKMKTLTCFTAEIPTKYSYSELVSTAEWKSFQEHCKENADLQSWDTELKEHAEEILKTVKSEGGLSIDSWKTITHYWWFSNKKIVEAILAFKKGITEGEGSSRKKKKNEERGNILTDEYIKNSSNMLDLLSEMENFLLLARNSHSYIAKMIQQYFEIPNGMSGAEFYGKIEDNLKKLRGSDNIFDHSAENLLKKAESLKSQYEEMLRNLQAEISKLVKKEKRAKLWKNVAYMIFVGAAVGLAIAGIVTAVIAAPPVAAAITSAIGPIAMAGNWTVSLLEESERAFKNQLELNEKMRKETGISIKDLGNIKSSIDGVINQINSVMYNPGSEMDREQLDFTMKEIKSKLGAFLNKVEDLEKDVEKTIKYIRKARDDVIS